MTPKTYSELLASGIAKADLHKDYVRISPGIYLPASELEPRGPRGLPLITRAIALQKRAPSCVLSGWAALKILGLPHISDDLPVHFWTTTCHAKPDLKLGTIPLRGRRSVPVQHVLFEAESLAVTDIATATVDCLLSLKRRTVSWWVPPITGLTHEEVRMIQVLDMVRTHCRTPLAEIIAAARGRFDAGFLSRLLALSDPGADSPQETLLRLIVRDLADWESQVPFHTPNGRLLTAADLASKKHKVTLFYDGEHHLARGQRDYDTEVVQLLRMMGWEPIRITSGQLRNPHLLRQRILKFLS
ncbi:hypothetical protein QVA66_10185 [Staphylococcus chromogenes]|nr:hypothetical protein [Staphylococcus chromogenes]